MDKGRKKQLEAVPTRKLLASIKKDMRKMAREAALAAKSKKK
jgi:hypothetical protein